MKNSIANWNYYTDFHKVYTNVNSIKVELNILNTLIGSKNIENDFVNLVDQYPEVLKVIPILLAKREQEIKVIADKEYTFNFNKTNYPLNKYVEFMQKTGLFDLLQNHIINNLVDYVLGIEVGLDTNARKNRTGRTMEEIVEQHLINAGLVKGVTYFSQMQTSEIEKHFKVDLSGLRSNKNTEKRFDFVIIYKNQIYGIECNFYQSSGSKLNETARSYKNMSQEAKKIQGFHFVWLTDGKGWQKNKNNLADTANVMEEIFNLNDLENHILLELLDNID